MKSKSNITWLPHEDLFSLSPWPTVTHLIYGGDNNSDDPNNDTNTRSYQLLKTYHASSTLICYFYCSQLYISIIIIIPILEIRKRRSRKGHLTTKFWSQEDLKPAPRLED